MKLSKLWLDEWVDNSLTAEALAYQLTMAGLEVDALIPVAGEFTKVIVAEVLSTKQHPNADKLTVCEVNAGEGGILQVVCGASNVRPKLKVALATIGAVLPGDFKIKESKLRGETSQGMLCSASELGLAEQSEGIIELDEEAPVGLDLRDYLQLNDRIFDLDLTPNRADCFSVLGVAREIAVLNQKALTHPNIEKTTPTIEDTYQVQLQDTTACPLYFGRIIRSINPEAKTPVWMAERLRRSGIRILHPVVDVLNYVMLELGQPMHAFDLERLQGSIQVRLAEPGEQLTLLNGQDLTLEDKALIISDQEKPLALAGIMGGADSSVQAHTQDIFLESAYFNPLVIAQAARKLHLFSDSSQRFERGVDPSLQIKALERATALLLSIVGGQPGPLTESVDLAQAPKKVHISFDTNRVEKLTGLSLTIEQMIALLEGLEIKVLDRKDVQLEVEVPTHRFDIQQEVDLIEEIIRIYGYNHLKAQPMKASLQVGKLNEIESRAKQLAHWFANHGFNETISYSFVDPEIQSAIYPNKEVMELLNPISSELSQMRVGLWPGLIASMIYNLHRQQNALKLFEIGTVFDKQQGSLVERDCIAGLLMGEQGGLNWCETTRYFDFFDLKGYLQALFATLKIDEVEFIPSTHEALHPGQSALIKLNGKDAGWIGVLHPKLADALDLQQDVILFEINLEATFRVKSLQYRPISKYPQIKRDLSFLIDEQINMAQVEHNIKSNIKEDWLKSLEVFDVYVGKNIPQGKKSLAVSLILQDESRTLVDAEINSLISAIINSLQNEFSIMLRE